MTTDGTNRTVAPVMAEIVVGLDDSPSAAAALRWAAHHSRQTGLPLRVVHVWQLHASDVARIADLWGVTTTDARARATCWVLNTLGGGAADVRWSLDIVEGSPGQALVERSRGARLLVLGSREHTGLRRVILGSVSHYCVSHAVPPVVAVPASPQEISPAEAHYESLTRP